MLNAEGDLIAAAATAPGAAAIAVARLSGNGAVALVDRFFCGARPLSGEPSRRMVLGRILREKDGVVVDEVLAVRFEEGASYTGEESVEVHCHGGTVAVRRCLDLFLAAGARLAAPGEFTKRAFLSGRLDLAQAEAVGLLIRSRSDAGLLAAERTLLGEFSRRLRTLMDVLTRLRAGLEIHLDYPEEIEDEGTEELARDVAEIRRNVADLLGRCRTGLALANGVRVAIVGKPNVGKSSLFNALIGAERAIVSDRPGTTRDTVDAATVHAGLAISFVDTAGIRKTPDQVEEMGVTRSLRAISEADLCVVVIDASSERDERDEALIDVLNGPALLAFSKCDRPSAATALALEDDGRFIRAIRTSALTGSGVEDLKDAICNVAAGDAAVTEGYAASERVVRALEEALSIVDEASAALSRGVGIDVAGSLLSEAATLLGEQLGVDATEELLDEIFSTFCVGK